MSINKYFLRGILSFLLLPLGLRVIDILGLLTFTKLIEKKQYHPNVKHKISVFTIATILYMAAIIVSDLVNRASYLDTAESLAIPFLTLLSVKYILLMNFSRLQYSIFCIGAVCSQIISLFLFSPGDFASNPLKFGALKALIFLLVFVLYLKKSSNYIYLISVLILGLVGAFYFDSRNTLIISIFAVLASFLHASFRLDASLVRLSNIRFLKYICALIILFFALNSSGVLVSSFLQNFYESEDSYFVVKTLTQARSNLGLILNSRSEFLSSIPAFMDSPVIGHGSNPQDINYKYTIKRLQRIESESLISTLLDRYDRIDKSYFNSITAHSHIFQSMVNTGIFGFYYWLTVIYIIASGCLVGKENERFFSSFLAVSLLFDIFFSPFGVNSRFYLLLLLPYLINPCFHTVKPMLAVDNSN